MRNDDDLKRNPEADLMETEMIEIRDPEDTLSETTAITISDIDAESEETGTRTGSGTGGQPHKKTGKHKRRMKPWVRVVLYVILIGSLIGAVYSGIQLYLGNKTYREGMDTYSKLVQETGKDPETADDMEYVPADFEALAKINPDVVAWITLPGTEIDYPVVQGTDNEYYLEHLFTKETNHTGCVFLDANNKNDFSDHNSILYAHHMRNGSMFSAVEDFRQKGFLEEHPYFVLQTKEAVYKIEPFADILGDAYSTYNQTEFADDQAFLRFIEDIRKNSTLKSDAVITAEDRVVILSTCRYDVAEGRYGLVGKLTLVKRTSD